MIYRYKLFEKNQIENILNTYKMSFFQPGKFGQDSVLKPHHKNNVEIDKVNDKTYVKLKSYVSDIIKNHKDFCKDMCVAKQGSHIFSQYKKGMFYEWHHDSPYMGGMRTDMSCTVFLSDPDEYEGGELSIMIGDIEKKFKEPAGTAIVYPTGMLHKVNEVTSGVRNVLVFWLESYIQDPNIRDILIDLNVVLEHFDRENLFETNKPIFQKLLKAKLNIERYNS